MEQYLYANYHQKVKVCSQIDLQTTLNYFARPLPVTFRFHGALIEDSNENVKAILDEWKEILKNWPDSLYGINRKPQPIAWMGYGKAWRLGSGQVALRDAPADSHLGKLAAWLRKATAYGCVVRQEEASMVPVALLSAVEESKNTKSMAINVADVCASPGSKTTQLVDAFLANGSSGVLMANDADLKRASVLAGRVTKACQLIGTKSLIVTHHDATKLPLEILANKFDYMVVDVPCSGDGTVRKDVHSRKEWCPSFGASLHTTQLRIALRALACLKVGGYLTYSTCSLHPIEDEAVVAAILRKLKGTVTLKSTQHFLPSLKRRPGLNTWSVVDDELTQFENMDEAREKASQPFKKFARRTMWPPDPGENFNLERCMRILPGDSDSGGFFVALFHKNTSIPLSSSNFNKQTKKSSDEQKQEKGIGNGTFMTASPEMIKFHEENFGLFKLSSCDSDTMVARSRKPKRLWSMTSEAASLATTPGLRTIGGGSLVQLNKRKKKVPNFET
eukprot:m.57832 g.57832  ORF g.57832 m.57832 type:complete len:505 (-) comp11136_c0_seq2:118-1632(-)